jgi:superfamily II DNA or RNA helicase
MAVDLIFSISQELRNRELFLIVNVEEKGRSRILYLPSLKEFGRVQPDLSAILIKEHCRESGISPMSHQALTLSCNKIRVRSEFSLEVLQKLIVSKKFFWKGLSLFFNPLSKTKFFLEVENLEEAGSISVSGFIEMNQKIEPISALDFIFPGKPIWGIHKQMVFVLPDEVRSSTLDLVYPESKQLQGKQRDRFIEDFEEDPPVETKWKGFCNMAGPKEESLLPVFPCLILKDSRGAFADLKMEYPSKSIEFEDPCSFSGRDLTAEKAWEKDLLETDFVRKAVESSHYYCPMDKISSSLSFLLEIGWKVLDVKGRRVMKIDGSDVMLLSEARGVMIKGSLRYGEHKVEIQNVIGAFNRRDRFVEISPGAVGLLDNSTEYEGLQDFSEAERVSEGCLLRPKQWGLLEAFSKLNNIQCDTATKSLIERLGDAKKDDLQINLDGFKGELRSYQKEGVDWLIFLYQNRLSGLLADEMGLGKTVQALAFFSKIMQESQKTVLIVVPTSLVFNWKKEWGQFVLETPLHVHEGSKRSSDLSFLQSQRAIITSYALLRIDFLLFQKMDFSCVLLDEAQWIKNPESQLARVLYALNSEVKVCLTGTPIENRADDLWSIFHFLEPELLGEKKEFLAQLQAAESDGRYKKRIQKLLRPFILRRLKEDVAQDLPEKMEQIVWVEMKESQRTLYENWVFKTKAGLLKKVELEGTSSHRMEILEAILRLRQISDHPILVDSEVSVDEGSSKMDRVLEDLEEVIQEGRKVLVYSQFTQMLQILKTQIKKRGWGYAYLDGNTKDRESEVVSFQEDPTIQIFLISLKAGGVGLNLTAADYVFLFDPWWNEAVERQAIDRAHRFGRKGAVIARRYIMAESIEAKIQKLKEHKTSLAEGILSFDGEESSIGLQQMIELLK